MPKSKYNTNLASEFHFLSMLHRLGVEALLTLGNKKSVDILVDSEGGETVTVEVKGLAGKTAWPVDNVKDSRENHVLVFVCYDNRIDDPKTLPKTWIIPSTEVADFVYQAPGGRRVVRLSTLERQAGRFRDNWVSITREATTN